MIAVYTQDGASDTEAIMESDQRLLLERGVSVTMGIMRLKQGRSHVAITNFTEEYQHLNKGASIGFLEEIQEESDVIAVADFPRSPDYGFESGDLSDVNLALPHKKQERIRA